MALPTRHKSLSHSNDIKKFSNCLLLRDHEIIRDDIWVRRGKIVNPESVFYGERKTPDAIVDCGGALIAPGFIDLQINGGFGVDFTNECDKIDEGVTKVAHGILAHGVTSFCPTLVSSLPEVYKTVLPRLRKRIGGIEGATVLGVHLEGPFINPDRKGAHDINAIQNGFEKGFSSIQETFGPMGNVLLVTLAPEIPGALDVIERLCNEKIIVCMGHSNADFSIGKQAVEKGASVITHLFNAMIPFHHRDPGLIGLISDKKPVMFGLIADGAHTHPATIRIAHRTNPEGVILVTDAISAAGLPEGTHHLGRASIDVRDGKAFLSQTNTLCGSITNFIDCVKNFKEASDCSIIEALEAGSLHPARVLKIDRLKGTLTYGADADFILLNDQLDVLQTYIAGNCVYTNENASDYVFAYEPATYDGTVNSMDVKSRRNKSIFFANLTKIYDS